MNASPISWEAGGKTGRQGGRMSGLSAALRRMRRMGRPLPWKGVLGRAGMRLPPSGKTQPPPAAVRQKGATVNGYVYDPPGGRARGKAGAGL